MGLISKTVRIKWNSMTKKYYENLGYTYTKMYDEFEVRVEDLPKKSTIEVDCKCDNCGCNLHWRYADYSKYVKDNGKTYCLKCGRKLFGTKTIIKNKLSNGSTKSFYDWCVENNRQDMLDRWDYELNDCSPKDVCYSSNKKYWFKCLFHKNHHSEEKQICKIIRGSDKCKQCNSIAQYILDNFPNKKLEEVWDYGKNGDLDPWNIGKGSNKKFWFICQTNKSHGSYFTRSYIFQKGCNCPKCVEERKQSKIEELTKIYLEELGYEVKTEYNTFKIINPKTKQLLPFDNEIIVEDNKHLIIEVHGEQHYKLLSKNHRYFKEGQTPEEYLYERKLIDRYKRIKCIQSGYEYLEIPYTAFDKKETYKELIDNKIKEILES